MIHRFDYIRPYTEKETMEAIKKMFTDPNFIKQLSIFKDKINVKEWVKKVLSCNTVLEFHLTFADKVFHYFAEKTCTNIHYSGYENINPKKQYLFIGNHRDIVLDSTLLQSCFFNHGEKATYTAIGNNLVSTPLFGELARLHKMFLVLRSGTLKEKIANTYLLSSYINHAIFEEKESVWIAQGNGRTKNGDDKTQQGLIKMLTLAASQEPLQTLLAMQITPVTVSYQYEPCAQAKARELALSENAPYTKQPGEDTDSIIKGITEFKGDVHFAIGKPLQQLDNISQKELTLNEKLALICTQIDTQIYDNYYLYPQNYIAIDIQDNSDRFYTQYTAEEKNMFLQYLNEKSTVADVSKEKMTKYLLDIYANPVRNKLRIEN